MTPTIKVLQLRPHTQALQDIQGCGRFQLLSLLLPSQLQIYCVNIYGWVGGAVSVSLVHYYLAVHERQRSFSYVKGDSEHGQGEG